MPNLWLNAVAVAVLAVLTPKPAAGQCAPALIDTTYLHATSMTTFQGDVLVGSPSGGTNPIRRFTGAGWTPFAPPPGFGVSAMTVYRDKLVAAGSGGRVQRWTGAAWEPIGGGANDTIYASAVFRGDLIIAGKFTMVDETTPASFIARWDGSAWQPLGKGLQGTEVYSLFVFNDELYAGGWFSSAGDGPANSIARWNGSSWSPVGTGLEGAVHAMTVYQGQLVAGGSFQTAGGVQTRIVARFDGTSWREFGPGLYHSIWYQGAVLCLAVYHDQLIVGGHFDTSDGHRVWKLGRWTGSEWREFGAPWMAPSLLQVNDQQIFVAGYYAGQLIRRYICAACTADLDADGQVDFLDYLAYLDLYAGLDPAADLNADGLVDFADWLIFIDSYSTGCV